jgi:hypothetical protein
MLFCLLADMELVTQAECGPSSRGGVSLDSKLYWDYRTLMLLSKGPRFVTNRNKIYGKTIPQ